MEDALEKLKMLTDELPAIPKLGDFKRVGERQPDVHYDIIGGTCFSFALMSTPEISVAKTFVTSGGEFPEHFHEEREFGIIFSGSALVRVNGIERKLGPGEMVIFEPRVPHWTKALEDTWFIAITIPQSKDYPTNERL